MFKKLTLIAALTFGTISLAQQDFKKWSVGINGGANGLNVTSGNNYKVANFGYLGLNTRYMTNNRFGLMLNLGYNKMTFESIDATTNHFKVSLEAVSNLGDLFNFSDWTQHIGLLFHGGAGAAIMTQKNANSDKMLFGTIGFRPIFKLGNKFNFNLDLSANLNLSQNKSFDMRSYIAQDGFDAYFYNLSAGLTYYIGKAEKHADWIYSGKPDMSKYDEAISNLEKALMDDDNDGVPNKFDTDNNTPEGATVNAKGVEVKDTDKDGIEDSKDACPEVAGKFSTNGCPDSDNDGVNDTDDNCPEIAGAFANAGCPEEGKASSIGGLADVNFNTNSAKISPMSYSVLSNAVSYLKENPSEKLDIIGNTDSEGSEVYNQALSERRANAVKNFLVKNGIDASRLNAKGMGSAKAKVLNDSFVGKAINRRVELIPTK